MSVELDVARWAFMSITKHFKVSQPLIQFYVEGEDRKKSSTNNLEVNLANVELRIDGPYIKRIPSFVEYSFEINTLISVLMDEQDTIRHLRVIGQLNNCYSDVILVYRLGGEAQDDESYVGCLERMPISGSDKELEVTHFGIIQPGTNINQSAIEGHYRLTLQG